MAALLLWGVFVLICPVEGHIFFDSPFEQASKMFHWQLPALLVA